MSLNERTKLKGLLEVVSSASEFEDVPIRHHEDILLKRIYDRSPVKLESQDYESPHFKTFVLLQAHFSRMVLPADLASDQAMILGRVIGLLSACVDVMSSSAYLSALGAMDLSQMCVQAMWETDSPLKQIPHFDTQVSFPYPFPCFLSSMYLTIFTFASDHFSMQGRRRRVCLRHHRARR